MDHKECVFGLATFATFTWGPKSETKIHQNLTLIIKLYALQVEIVRADA